jgi:acyl-[acyl-carrier-protein]-phospholipid O-acyltransferase / long-chain-fatty-acid--[acyl-carrier-protein] ligase
MKRFLRLLVGWLFKFRAYNEDVLTTPGPVLLLPNHVSWLDWLFLLVCTDEDWKCVVSKRTAQTSWIHRKIMINRRTFPIDTESPYAVKHMAEFLEKGGRLALFPEGRLSRTGTLMKIFDGTGFLLHKTKAKVITCYLRGTDRIPTSPNPNRKLWRPTISAHFSEVLTPPQVQHLSTAQARSLYSNWLRDKMVEQQFQTEMQLGPSTVPEAILESARRAPHFTVLEDVSGALTYKKLLIGSNLMAEQLGQVLSRNNPRVGVLLPNINATPVVLLSLWAMGVEPALFNYSTGPAIMIACAKLAKVSQVITSRAFLERAKLNVSALAAEGIEFIYLEEIRGKITGLAKFKALLKQTLFPGLGGESQIHPAIAGQTDSRASKPAVVLFTSGSEGVPKAVELTHGNILANIRQMVAVTDITDEDRLFNAMPTFHSFGLTVGTLFPLIRGIYVYIYPSPLHYRVVPTVFYNADCTIMISTNTFLNGYARKANPYDFRSLRYLFAAAEKLQEATATAWAQRYGVRVLEGYGATECSPCISLNTPLQAKYGSAGRFMPGMNYKIEPVDGVPEGGRLFVSGPNIMKGYIKPEETPKSPTHNGWYDTGDIVRVDPEGFLFIQGRLKRFAKISGEMVSLTAVEDALAGAFPQYGLRCQIAVVAVHDEERGEKLIAIANDAKLSIEEIRNAIKLKGLPNIAVPREVRFIHDIPKLGTGKVNYRELEKNL